MIQGLGPYPEYQDGPGWLGPVPAHWRVIPNRAVLSEVDERDHPSDEMLSVTIATGVIRQQTLLADSSMKDSSNQDKSAYKLVRPGDIVYNKMRAWQGAVGESRYRGIVSPAYVVQRPRGGTRSRYLHFLLRTPAFAKEAERWSYGIASDMWSLRAEHFKMIQTCVPPVDEQSAIVRFLDHVDRRIRRYIGAKQKLIKLLDEQKQAIVHRAATRGLDADVHLKPSGVEWLGDVPDHWEVAPLRRHWTVTDCKHLTVPFLDDGIPLASVREVQSFDLDLASSRRTSADWYQILIAGGRRPQRGDIIYCRNVSVGAAAIVGTNTQFAMGQDVCVIRSTNQNQRYLNYFLHSPAMRRQLDQLLVGSTFKRINVADIKGLVIAVPPRTEQDAIAAHLDQAFEHLQHPISLTRREIDLMRQYETRLIADLVTGKLDVREAAARLPPEPLDEAEALTDSEDATAEDLDAEPEEAEV